MRVRSTAIGNIDGIGRLEVACVAYRLADFPPLSNAETEALVARVAGGEKWTREETVRAARRCPYNPGGLVITAHRGEVFIKRYPALDMAEI